MAHTLTVLGTLAQRAAHATGSAWCACVVVAVVVTVLGGGVGCTTTTTFRAAGSSGADSPRGSLVVDEHDYGAMPPGGIDVPIPAGYAPVAWRVVEGGEVLAEGTVERDQVAWGVVIGAGLAAACCVPTAAATGFCLANPALLTAPITCLLAGNPGVVITACAAPGWSSIPLTSIGAAVGATPLLFGFMGQHLPPSVELSALPPRPAAPTPTTPTGPAAPADAPADAIPPTPTPADGGTPGAMWF